MNHAELGAMIAEKWNFPDRLVAAIRYHHDPSTAPPEYRDLVDAVYLANMFCEYENGNISFDQIELESAKNYRLQSKKQLDKFLEQISSALTKERQA
jgi:HD-like signal output (HDOD) protein